VKGTIMMNDDDAPLEPAEMLSLAEHQQEAVTSASAAFVSWITLAWGLAWTVGFTALFLIDGARPAFALPLPLAVTVFAVLLVAAIAASAVLGTRANNGVRGSAERSFTGTVYGLTWSVSMFALYLVWVGLRSQGVIDEAGSNVYLPVAFILMTGILYLVSAAIWRAVPALVLGLWLIVVAAAGAFIPYPWHYLFFAVAGGGAFLVFTGVTLLWMRRLRAGRSAPRLAGSI
jgi:hypothetical protein